MRRNLWGLLAISLLMTPPAARAQVSVISSYYTDTLLDGITLPGLDDDERAIAGPGFAMQRLYVAGMARSPEEETSIEIRPTTLYFMVHGESTYSSMGLATIQVSGEPVLPARVSDSFNDLGTAGVIDPLSRLSLAEYAPESPGGPERWEMFFTSPYFETVTSLPISPDPGQGVTATTFTADQWDDLDEFLGDPLGARAPADVTAAPFELYDSRPQEAVSPEMAYLVKFCDLPTTLMILDEENQPVDAGNGPTFIEEGAALLRRVNRLDATPINQTALTSPTDWSLVSTPDAFGLPQGIAIETLPNVPIPPENPGDPAPPQDPDQIFFVVREGGFRDTVYVADAARTVEDNVPPLQDGLPRGTVRLFSNMDLNPLYPQRIVDIEVEPDPVLLVPTMWVRMESVRSSSGTLLYPDLYHVYPFGITDDPVTTDIGPDARNRYFRGDTNFDGIIDAGDEVQLTEFAQTGTIPANPILQYRLDVDGDADIDYLDFEQIRTHPLVTRSSYPEDPSATSLPALEDPPILTFESFAGSTLELGGDRVYDIEVVDFNNDSQPDVTALIERGSGASAKTYLVAAPNRGTSDIFEPVTSEDPEEPALPPVTEIELGGPARLLEWVDWNLDGRLDAAMVTTPTNANGQLYIGFNQTPTAATTLSMALTPGFDAGYAPFELAVGEVDSNDYSDILVGNNQATSNLRVFYGASASLTPWVVTVPDAPRAMVLGPLQPKALFANTTGDRYDDLVMGADADFALQVIGNGLLTATSPLADLDTSSSPRAAVLGRFVTAEATFGTPAGFSNDQPDFIDVALAEFTQSGGPAIEFYRQLGTYQGGRLVSTTFEPAAVLTVSSFSNAATINAADFNLDGRSDVVVTGRNSNGRGQAIIYAANPLMVPFTVAEQPLNGWAIRFTSFSGSLSDAEPCDVDGDGDDDVIVGLTGSLSSNGLAVWLNNASTESPVSTVVAARP